MLKTSKTTLWLGASCAILALGLTGCGGNKKSSSSSGSTAAGVNSGTTTGGTTPGTTTGGTTGGGTTGGGTTGGGTTTPPGVTDDHGNDAANSTAISMANPTAGQIDYAADADWFVASLSAGVDYDFFTQNLAGGMDTILRLIDTNGTAVLAENDDDASGGPASRLTFQVPADGDYYLAVFHKDATADTGTYDVNYILSTGAGPGPDDHGNDAANATVIAVGTPTAGKIEVGTDEDWFEVPLTGGTTYTFRTNVADPTQDDTVLYLYDSAGNLLADNDDISYPSQVNSEIAQWDAPADGDYYLVVTGFQGLGTTPSYEIFADTASAPPPPPQDDHGNDAASSTAITLGAPTAGKIEVGTDEDWFGVTLVSGTSYDFRTITAQPDTLDGDTVLELYDAAGTLLDENDDISYPSERNSAIDGFVAPADGDYYLKVTGFQALANTPDYEILADVTGSTPPPTTQDDHGNDAQNATAIALATPTAGKVEVGTDEDWFAVALVAGKDYVFTTVTADDTTLTLNDVDGTTLLDYNDDDPMARGALSSRIEYTAPADGTYYLIVAGNNGTTPDYQILAEEKAVTPPPAAGANMVSSSFNDLDGSNNASQGDEIVVQFSEDVGMILPAIFPPPTITADSQFTLPVAGDTFGVGASMVMGPGANEATIILGSDPVIKLSGTFDAANVAAGDASGIDMAAGNTVETMSNQQPAAAGVIDLDSSLTPGFYADATLNEARGMHSATELADGRVLVIGGAKTAPTDFAYENELYDAGAWTNASDPALGGPVAGYMAAMTNSGSVVAVGRWDHTANLLPNGQVLIAGGIGYEGREDANGNPVVADMFSAFLFDPTTNSFMATNTAINAPRRGHEAVVMPNGNVLFMGGYSSANGLTMPFCEVFDYVTGQFTLLQNDMAIPRQRFSAHLQANGTVLNVGGYFYAPDPSGSGQINLYVTPTCELYDMASGGVAGPNLQTARRWAAGAEDSAGNVFAVGGNGVVNGATAMLDDVEKYDPVAGGDFTVVGTLAAPRGRHSAHGMGSSLLVVGGMSVDASTGTVTNLTTGELFNTVAGVTETYQMQSDRNSHASLKLKSGRVLVTGGWAGGTTDLYGFDGTAVPGCESFIIP